jgi:hypothetical protein
MTGKNIRIFKEARSLFWPWLAVITAAALPLLERPWSAGSWAAPLWGIHQVIEPASFLGFFIGLPLLATFSLGNEFQCRTIPLLLSQPVGRTEIWSEKIIVALAAILSAASLFCITGWNVLQQDPTMGIIFAALMIPMVASAPFWTLLARSTLGGLALNALNAAIPVIWLNRRDWIPHSALTRSVALLAVLCYSGVMLWLGRRGLARFEATGGQAGDDLLMAGPNVLPGAVSEWFRCRPTGLLLNLVRKEFRQLRPVWLISLLAIPIWICLPLFGHTSEGESIPAFILVVAFIPLVAVLAGSLSLGEERTSGAHSLQLTLPVSSGRQWLIKLAMAMFTSLSCAVLLPTWALMVSRSIFGRSHWPLDSSWISWALPVSLLTFASFWCACTVNGTVRAALCVFPTLIALFLTGRFGDWIAWEFDSSGGLVFVASKLGLFKNFRFTKAVANVNPFDKVVPSSLVLLILLFPVLVVAVLQSRWLFRKQLQDSSFFVVRRLLPLALTVFLCSFSLPTLNNFVFGANEQMWAMFRETRDAIDKIQPGLAIPDDSNLVAAPPLQLTLEDLSKAAPLSERTLRWLRGARITVSRGAPHFGGHYCCGEDSGLFTIHPDKAHPWYLATIHLPSGTVCTMSFQPGRTWATLGGVCK